jgi:hypothetical protein
MVTYGKPSDLLGQPDASFPFESTTGSGAFRSRRASGKGHLTEQRVSPGYPAKQNRACRFDCSRRLHASGSLFMKNRIRMTIEVSSISQPLIQ